MTAHALTLETKQQDNQTVVMGHLQMTPPLDGDYWEYRVRLSDRQAIVGFPKFSTVGIGFAVEDDDWNTNLPYTCSAEDIYAHIECNKGDDSITREACLAAIELIQAAIEADRS